MLYDSSALKSKTHFNYPDSKNVWEGDAIVLKVQARFFLFCIRVYGFLDCASSLVFLVGCKDERQDCDRLIAKTGGGEKLEKYCKKWKDEPAVKQCLATCNMCEH